MKNKRLPADQMFVKGFQELLEVMLSNPFMSYLDYDSVRIDLFETEQSFIVEAELLGYHLRILSFRYKLTTYSSQPKNTALENFMMKSKERLQENKWKKALNVQLTFRFH